jgi:fused signal recognition particle receptor
MMFGFTNKDRESESVDADKKDGSGLFSRLRRGLAKTGSTITEGLTELVTRRRAIDDALLEEIEARLLMADVGVEATAQIVDALRAAASRAEAKDAEGLFARLESEMIGILAPVQQPLDVAAAHPFVILVAGVNGAGKTTTIGKLALRFRREGRSVMLAAGDTFRAAAVEQLQVWGERNQVPVITQGSGADSASVVFDALQAARSRKTDVLIADTAGRLHTQTRLMDELKKIKRVLTKVDSRAPHETLLVLDATAGQNALNQARQFTDSIGVTGIALTKLDGTAKGGIAFAIAKALKLPFRFVGVGEDIEDLREFEAKPFVRALLGRPQ